MADTAQEAYDAIVAFIQQEGSGARNWYAGIASDWKARLRDHGIAVGAKDIWYIYRPCKSSSAARSVEKSLLERGCAGGAGGGDDSTVWAYAYRKAPSTDP